MKRNILIIYTVIIACVFSCSDIQKNQFQKAINEMNLPKGTEYVLVLEQSGCSTCLYKANRFFEENRTNKNVVYIFNGFISLKNIKLKYKISGTEVNMKLDTGAVFYRNKARIEYPTILYLSNGEIED